MKVINQKRAARTVEHRKELMRKYNYGLEFGEYARMFDEQNGLCAICGLPEKSLHFNGKPRSLFVDHDHETGQVRSLLCMKCNIGLGQFNDDTGLIEKAIGYLQKHRVV